MKRRYLIFPLMLCLGTQVPAQESQTLTTYKDKLSYWFGQQFGQAFRKNIDDYVTQKQLDLNQEQLAKGVEDALLRNPSLLTEDEIKSVLMRLQQEQYVKHLAAKNLKEGEAFLAKKKEEEGVVTLPSGLQYKVIRKGTGKTPKDTDSVTTHYRGTFIDGKEFDSSYKGGEPATFPVKGVIAGWTEALQLMKEGAKWQLFIPADLAYGKNGTRGIAPNSTLIFDIELLSVNGEEIKK
jgi:FKBP-type peptidyl-prolyl cis-trans isomerase